MLLWGCEEVLLLSLESMRLHAVEFVEASPRRLVRYLESHGTLIDMLYSGPKELVGQRKGRDLGRSGGRSPFVARLSG